ncbi:MAG: hypothetical protein JW863_09395 [Chitinispirillaceae bacterium]|nr:hypothetical protein [Chitinispirillaceae bacterium]
MIVVRKEFCSQNHSCPVGAISQNGFSAPVVDDEKCICCCKCVKRCSVFMPIGCCGQGAGRVDGVKRNGVCSIAETFN